MKRFITFFPVIFLLLYLIILYRPFFLEGKLPIPADTIVGLYHPWRDKLADQYPNGVPFKNFLITDPVRQQYVWRELAIDSLKKHEMPNWDPYSFIGAPLLANLQTAVFYPLNFLYFFLPFASTWSWQIILQTLLGGLFMILYLRHLKLQPEAQALGAIAWVGSGFFMAWLEWNTLVQAAIWIPLLLLSVDKISTGSRKWCIVFILSLVFSFFAGHLQVFFYVFLLTFAYALRVLTREKNHSSIKFFLLSYLFFFLLTSVQWVPMITLFQQGIRAINLSDWQKPEWFLPSQNLVQFIAPDFFGNPATLNYFGVWNYIEFVGYLGIVPLLFVFLAIIYRGKKTIFWLAVLGMSLLFSLRNPISELPYRLQLPFIAAAQPTRLMVLTNFSMAILAAIGLDHFLKEDNSRRKILIVAGVLIGIIVVLRAITFRYDLLISQKNLILPTLLLLVSGAVLMLRKNLAVVILLVLTVLDLGRFALKFESFSSPDFVYPETKIIRFLQEQAKTDVFRVAALDDRIFPPNFSTHYKLQMISGYDSMFLRNYTRLVGNSYYRIITPKDYKETVFNQLNVRYLLTFDDITDKGYELVLQEGITKVYENKKVLPRAFFADKTGLVEIEKYSENEIIIKTQNPSDATLVLLDAYYPGWKVTIDGLPAKIFLTDLAFRGVTVSKGEHLIRFSI